MLFNTYEFIYIFLPLVFLAYRVTAIFGHSKAQILLCSVSLAFYCFMAVEYLPLLLFSVMVNYFFGKIVHKQEKVWLLIGIIFNVCILFFFKYFDFVFIEVLKINQSVRNLVIPLGVSFYTFTQIAYLVDLYKGEASLNKSFISYLLFVSYFPHLIAGPILHHRNMMEQFQEKNNYMINYDNIIIGIFFVVVGLSKKILIADNLIPFATPVFKAVSMKEAISPLEGWCGAIAYSFQLYFDFSGYSDMAIGISKFFNFNLPINFNSPYKSISIIDFWRRWHLSLSDFLRDYLYIPFGGNRHGRIRRYSNLLIVMAIGGIWHGANWTFLVWGIYHGILLSLNHLLKQMPVKVFIPKIIRFGSTFFLIVIGWIIFRSESIEDVINYFVCLLNFEQYCMLPENWATVVQKIPIKVGLLCMPYFFGKSEIILLLLAAFICFCIPNSQNIVSKYSHHFLRSYFNLVILILLLIACLYQIDNRSEFIYSQF